MSKQVAGAIQSCREQRHHPLTDNDENPIARIGRIIDRLTEDEWWLIKSEQDVEWLCEQLLRAQALGETRGVA